MFGNQISYTSNGIGYIYYTYRSDGLRHSIGDKVHVWDGANIVADVDGNNVIVYIRGINLIYADDGDKTYYHFNAHSDVVALTDESGNKTKSYSYSAFGVEYNESTLDDNPFRYCGEYYDKETKTIDLRARYYDANQGRFTQQDSWEFANAEIPLSLNLYTYCWNNPVIYADYSGNAPFFALAFLVVGILFFSGCSNNNVVVKGVPKYEPNKWNTENYLNFTNCYAYAFDMMENPITGKNFSKGGLQLGMLSGMYDYKNLTKRDAVQISRMLTGDSLGNSILIDTITKDMKAVGIKFQAYQEGLQGGYKVALFLNPGQDFHWYRENGDGTWSHKLGNSKVTNEIAYRDPIDDEFMYTGEIITDPEVAAKIAGYPVLVGYFYVSN